MYLGYILCTIASSTDFVQLGTMSQDERVQYKFMIPADLKKRLEDSAAEGRRSLSQEIVMRLEESVEGLARVDIGKISHALSDVSKDDADEALEALQSLMDGLDRVKILLERDNQSAQE